MADGHQHSCPPQKRGPRVVGTTLLEAKPGMATLRMADFFSGVKHKASIAEQLNSRCAKRGLVLVVFEIDVLVGGQQQDLLKEGS